MQFFPNLLTLDPPLLEYRFFALCFGLCDGGCREIFLERVFFLREYIRGFSEHLCFCGVVVCFVELLRVIGGNWSY